MQRITLPFILTLTIITFSYQNSYAENFSRAVDELNSCTLIPGVRSLKSLYVDKYESLTFGIEDETLSLIAIKMEDVTFNFDGFTIKFECIEPGCIAQKLYSAWPRKLMWAKKLSLYTLYACTPESQSRVFDALQTGD